jgi:flagellar protein FlaJ
MGMVVNDMEYLGTDFVSALENAAEVTPCDRTADLLTDMVGVLETGGDFEAFLADRRSQVVEQLSSEQESYLERLGLYAEMYVTLLVAGPLFVIVLLLVIGILGSSTLPQVATLTYVGLPLGSAFAVVALDVFGAPVTGGEGGAASPPERPRPAVPDDPDARAYAERKRRAQRRDRLLDPVEELVRSPARSLYATVPLALVVAGVVALSGLATPSVAALRSQPVWTTAFLGLLPFLVVTVPLAVLGELRARYARRVRERFPDLLSSIARANRTGVSIVEAIEMEADRSTGVVERELRELRNDIRWFSDPSAAFRRFAARARLSITTRTMTLVAEANDASGDLQRTLSVAADDARFQRTFTRSRAREVATYVAVAVISFLVFLGILVLVQEFYLQRAVEAAAGASTSDLAADLPGSLQDIDVAGFRVAFLHAAVIQGACIGFVAGKLARGTVLVGVKYSIVMSTLALAAFGVVV